jgi:pilus assembly protein CpaB
MRRFPEQAIYLATFGTMTAAALAVVALIIVGSGSDRDGDTAMTTPVVVAARDIPAGTMITPDMLKVTNVPHELVVTGSYSDTSLLVGMVTNYHIARDEAFTPSKVGPGPAEIPHISVIRPGNPH